MSTKTFYIQITGRVQGVGFRPFVYRLAQQHKLCGTVTNSRDGVEIYLTTTPNKATAFLSEIRKHPPSIAWIQSSKMEQTPLQTFEDFKIIPSTTTQVNIHLTPDFAICKECKAEVNDPKNRRYGYPFTTCVNCGPRYAITTHFPFERGHTSLHSFQMCATCQTEYSQASDRRFHSQTNTCINCGIQLTLTNSLGKMNIPQQQILKKVGSLIVEGNIIAIKNTFGYVLCCDANQAEVIHRLRARKQRPKKPFAILYPTMDYIQKEFQPTTKERELLCSAAAPIVILKNTLKTNIAKAAIAPGLDQTGVFLPASGLLFLLMEIVKRPLVCTSGNIHGAPIIAKKEEAETALHSVADYFLHHNLPIAFPQDDSVVKVVEETPIFLRRARGYAPNYEGVQTNNKTTILAMGSDLKSAFTLLPNAHVYVSQYLGNLNSFDTLKRYKRTLAQQLQLFDLQPQIVLGDAHPSYQSSMLGREWAEKQKAQYIEIQHHKAHFASVLGEHDLFGMDKKILGVVWDGTGYGDDQAIWGGEFFSYHQGNMERINHFEYYDWIAQDKMAQEPRIALFCLLKEDYREGIKHKFSSTEWQVYDQLLKRNTLKTSSAGRLFDAAAAALELIDFNTYEAEAAMQLERCASDYCKSDFIDFLEGTNPNTIPVKQLINCLFLSYQKGAAKAFLAASFINTLAKCIITQAKHNGFSCIACSGGVFQNTFLLQRLKLLAKLEDLDLKINCKLSPNDENISFGQLMLHINQ